MIWVEAFGAVAWVVLIGWFLCRDAGVWWGYGGRESLVGLSDERDLAESA